MFRKLFMIFVVGLGGTAVLVALGVWQVQRLDWKQSMLSEIETRIAAAPVPLPSDPNPLRDQYLPVTAEGHVGGVPVRVLTSRKNVGAGHRLIVPFLTGDRRVLLDLGFLPEGQDAPDLGDRDLAVTGNLHWPDETDSFTPEPDLGEGLWFARDVPALAEALGTEPILVVRRDGDDIPGVTPWPVDTTGIPNDHLGYAITWFSLAVIWLAMTGVLVYRMRKPEGDVA